MKKKKLIQRQTQNLLALSESNTTAKLQDRRNQKRNHYNKHRFYILYQWKVKNKPKGNYQNKTNTLCKLTLEKSFRENK